MNAKIEAIQIILGTVPDGIWGPVTQSALDELIKLSKGQAPKKSVSSGSSGMVVSGLASSFADLADVEAFKKCKAQGNSDEQCFRVGDNGQGCYGEDVTTLEIPFVAIPPDYMIEWWGGVENAKYKKVIVTCNGQTHLCTVGDRMPWLKNIKNKAVLDMAPGAQKLFGLTPPFMVPVKYSQA